MLFSSAHTKKRFLFLACLLFARLSFAQFEDSSFIHYTIRDGLSDNYINALEQDDWGYIWIGTESGLNRFDGYSFKRFNTSGTALPLLAETIRKLKVYGPHQLGILSRVGLQLLNTRDLSFSSYQIPDTTPFTIYHNAIFDAEYFPDKSVAITTSAGFYVFKNPGEMFVQFEAYKAADVGKKRIRYGRDILPVNDKERIIYTEENRLGYYNTATRQYHEIPPDDTNWELFKMVPRMQGNEHTLPFPTGNNGFLFFYLLKDSVVFYNHLTGKLVYSPTAFSVRKDLTWQSNITRLNDSSFAINCGASGFYFFHLDQRTGHVDCNPRKYLSSYKINSLFFDKDNRLWVGTTKGLLQQRFTRPFLKKYYYPSLPSDISTLGMQNAYRYKDKIYVCRYSRFNGLLVIDTGTMQIEKRVILFNNDDPVNEITSVQMYHPDTLWLGTNGGIIWLDTKTLRYGKVADPFNYFAASSGAVVLAAPREDGYAWFCKLLGGVAGRYHIPTRQFEYFTSRTNPALPFEKIKSITYDAYGDIWLGGHALARWNSQKQNFDTLITLYGGVNKFNDDILTIRADAHGSLWLSNVENGLLEYRIREKKFVAYTTNDGLPAMMLNCFSPVIDDILWIGSANNLTRFDTKTKKSFVYDYHDGFPDESPAGRQIYFDSATRKYYLFTKDYLVEFPFVQQEQKPHVELLFQEVLVNDKRSIFHPGDTLALKYGENNLVLQFSLIDYESPNSYQLSYRVNNTTRWTPVGPQRTINFTELQPGKYILQVKATGNNDTEDTRTITIIIAPPFWQTAWFILLCLAIAGVLLGFFYLNRIKRIRQRAELDKHLAQTEMKALHAQMNPHFIFNCLNSIREMILNKDTREASHFLSKFAHLMRLTLDHSSRTSITLRNTIDYLHRYMEMEQIRNAEFTCRILADADLDQDETLLPPLLIQPFIENAIWHGVTGDRKNININIDFRKDKRQLVCIIDDNGIGIDRSLQNKLTSTASHLSVGIANVRNRIHLLNEKYGLESSVILEDKSILPGTLETGTRVTIRLPLQLQEYE
ncbi:MAG: histidine kinase [Chitinophagaceae bacterium]